MYYILFYNTIKDYVEKRIPIREKHLSHAKAAFERGELIMAGALDNPVDKAVLIFKGLDTSAVGKFVKNDPYYLNGLITSWEIRPWTVVIGGEG